MIKPLWAVAGVALLGTAGIAALSGLRTSRAQQGELMVTPSSGPVGTVVALEGRDCNLPGVQQVRIVFQSSGITGAATQGADDLSNFAIDSDGRFRVNYTIPLEFAAGSLQGAGGGPLKPGLYEFITKPPICTATFTVTSAGLPDTGGRPGGRNSVPLFSVAALIAGSIPLLLALLMVRRIRSS